MKVLRDMRSNHLQKFEQEPVVGSHVDKYILYIIITAEFLLSMTEVHKLTSLLPPDYPKRQQFKTRAPPELAAFRELTPTRLSHFISSPSHLCTNSLPWVTLVVWKTQDS